MRKFLLVLIPLAALATACNVFNKQAAPAAKTAFQQSVEDLSLSYDLAAKKQLLVNNQERHAAEMARQEAELQLRARGISELPAAIERLAAQQRAFGDEIRRRTPPPPPTRSAMPPPAEVEAPQMAEASAGTTSTEEPRPIVRQDNRPTIIAGNPWAPVQMAQVDTVLPRPTSPRGRRSGRQFLQNTAAWSAIGGGTGAVAGAIHSGRRGAISGGWKGAAAGAALGLLTEAFRQR